MIMSVIFKSLILLLIITFLLILFVVLGNDSKTEKQPTLSCPTEEVKKSEESLFEEEMPLPEEEIYEPEILPYEEEMEEENPIPNCNAPLKELDNIIPKAPEPVDPLQSECMELDNQETIIHEMLDWGDDDYPDPSYKYNKFCTD